MVNSDYLVILLKMKLINNNLEVFLLLIIFLYWSHDAFDQGSYYDLKNIWTFLLVTFLSGVLY